MTKSLSSLNSPLSNTKRQLKILISGPFADGDLETFQQKLEKANQFPLSPTELEIFQINVGYMCNQTCSHCHVDAGPDRKEIMSKENLQLCLDIIKKHNLKTVDLTGGAPEMNPHFFWFVEELGKLNIEIIVRSNLTIIEANKKYHILPEFFKQNKVRVISSLPFYTSSRTDKQRGKGVFDKSISALQKLNAVGYGLPSSELTLDLVYNPVGPFLPDDQAALEAEYKKELKQNFDIDFNSLFTITNLPISRFLDYLIASENYEDYMYKLVDAFNPSAVNGVMCKNTLSVDWQGNIYDCDFNQMLQLGVESKTSNQISNFNITELLSRNIVVNQHCFGCTAGAGSSCQGTTI